MRHDSPLRLLGLHLSEADSEPIEDRLRKTIAARAAEQKRVRKHTCDLLLQRLTQQLAGAMQACAHGLRLQTQEKSGFLDAHLLNVAHDKHDAVVLGQAADRSFQETADIRKRSGLFGTKL